MSSSSSQVERVGQGTIKAGRYLWIMLPLVLGAQMSTTIIGQGISVLYPFIQNEFGLSHAQVGLITSSRAIGGMAILVLAGWLTDYLGVKRIIAISLLSTVAFAVAFPLAHSWHIILALVAFIGVAGSPGYPATTRAIMDWVPNRIRALAMSFKQAGIPVGGTITAAVLPALALIIGWRMAAAAAGMLILVIAIVFLLLYRDAPRGRREIVQKLNFATLKAILRERSILITAIWGSTFVGFQWIVMSYFMLFLIEELRLSPIMAGGLLAVAQVSSAITRILWGAASDFIFHGRRKVVLVIIGLLTVIWMLGASLMNVGFPKLVVFLIATNIGISTISFHGVFTTLIGELAEWEQIGTTVGLVDTMMAASSIVLPPLFGYLVDISNSYSLGWRVAAGVALVCTLALLAFGRDPQRR